MKLAVLGESPADEAALRIIAGSLLGAPVEPWSRDLRSRGWPSVRDILPSIIFQLHYWTDVEALIVVIDSDASEPHGVDHVGGTAGDCRLCGLFEVVQKTVRRLRPAERPPLRIGLGLAVPCVEAWYLCGKNAHVSEATWINGRREGRQPYSCLDLKRALYGTDRPSLAVETEIVVAEAIRLASDLTVLTRLFPAGFGALAEELARWR